MNTTNHTSLKGIIIPNSWDRDGKVVRIAIVTYKEEQFSIADDAQGRKLMSLLRKRTLLNGHIVLKENQSEFVVNSFQLDTSCPGEKRKNEK